MLKVLSSIVFDLWVVCLLFVIIQFIIKAINKYLYRKVLYKIFSCFYDIANLSIMIDLQLPITLNNGKMKLLRHFISDYLKNGDDRYGHFYVESEDDIFEFSIRIKDNKIINSTLNLTANKDTVEIFSFGDNMKTRVFVKELQHLRMMFSVLSFMRNFLFMSLSDDHFAEKFGDDIKIYDIKWKSMSHSEIKDDEEVEYEYYLKNFIKNL